MACLNKLTWSHLVFYIHYTHTERALFVQSAALLWTFRLRSCSLLRSLHFLSIARYLSLNCSLLQHSLSLQIIFSHLPCECRNLTTFARLRRFRCWRYHHKENLGVFYSNRNTKTEPRINKSLNKFAFIFLVAWVLFLFSVQTFFTNCSTEFNN